MTDSRVLTASDPELQTAVLDGHPFGFVDEGPRHAPPLVLVPGIPGTVRDFRFLAPLLTDALRVVRVDPPGFGGSAPVRDALATLPGRARAVLRLADRLGLRRFGVLGHSMGGGTALALAALHPERVRLLALVCSLALRPHRGLGMTPATFRRAALGLRVPLLRRWLLPRVREAYRRRGFPGADTLTAGDFAVHLRAIGAADFALLRRWVSGPLPTALVAYARDDHMVETGISEELVRALPQARVLAFDEGGHNLQKTRAAELAAAIKDCFSSAEAAERKANTAEGRTGP